MSISSFTISADPSSNAGYDATNSEVLTLQLENLPATDVSRVQFSVTQSSAGCPAITFTPSSGEPATVGGTVTLTCPATGTHSFTLQCVVNNGVDNNGITRTTYYSYRQVVIRSATANLAKITPAERDEYDTSNGWTVKHNEVIDYVDGLAASVDAAPSKSPVYAVALNNVALTGAPAMGNTDNVTVSAGSRLLLVNQTAPAENGIWVTAAGAWARAEDADSEADLLGLEVTALYGATKALHVYGLDTTGTITVGTTALTFTERPAKADKVTLDAATANVTAGQLAKGDGAGGVAFAYLAASSYLSVGSNVASAGALRMANALYIKWRNAANSTDVDGIAVDNADKMLIGDATDTAGIGLYSKAANSVDFTFAANTRLSVKDALIEFQPSATAHIKQADATAGAGSLFEITAQTAFAGVGGGIRITTGRGATNADQCGGLTVNLGDDTTDSAELLLTSRTLGTLASVKYVAADLGMQLTTTKPLGLRGLAVTVDPGDDGFDTTNYISFTAPANANWLRIRCDNTAHGTEIKSGANPLWLNSTSTTTIDATSAVYLTVGDVEKVGVEASGARFFGGAGYGTGTGVISIANASVNPSTNPTGGGVLYADGGAGKWRGSGGTVTTFGPAEPHCPTCTRDFAIEYENESNDEHLAICWCCLLEQLESLGVDVAKVAFKKKLVKQSEAMLQAPKTTTAKAKKK